MRHRQQRGALGARPGRQPVVGPRGGVGQPRVEHGELRALALRLDEPLGVRVEVVPGLEVRGAQQHELRVRVVGRRAVGARPEAVARAAAGGAHVGVRVVAVRAPRLQEAVGEPVLAGAADEVHDVVRAPGGERRVEALGERVEHVLPAHPLPLARAARADPALRVEDPLRVVDLVERRRALGAVAPARARVVRVALELLDLEGLAVHVGEQPAGGLAVEADRRHQRVLAGDLARPLLRVVLGPAVPLVRRWVGAQGHQLSGTLWPARTQASS